MKFALLLTAVFALAVSALSLLQHLQRQAMAELLESETRERSAMLARVIALTSQTLLDFTRDYSQWDDMVRFVEKPEREWAAINIDASLGNFKIASAWVLSVDGALVYASRGEDNTPPTSLPIDAATLAALLKTKSKPTWFVWTPDGLLELCLSPIQPSEDTKRLTTPRGWLLAGRAWDASQTALLAELLQCEVLLTPPGAPLPQAGVHQISLRHPLEGPRREVVSELIYTVRSRELEIVSQHNRTQLWLFVVAGLLAALLALILLNRWVMSPLEAIGESLARADTAPLASLIRQQDELGRVAQLVQTSFTQRAALENMLAERARLGRELHDGVIQTVFAAGMNLSGARSALRTKPAEAERILDDTHAELNTTIRELRSFIAGLEPEASTERSLSDGIHSIATLMQGVRPIACTIDVDETVAANCTRPQRLHVLQIVREALSNSVRHSQARQVRVSLRRDSADASLEIADDGAGLDRARESERGRGLDNLAARAADLGGTIQIDSERGRGVRVRIVFPIRLATSVATTPRGNVP